MFNPIKTQIFLISKEEEILLNELFDSFSTNCTVSINSNFSFDFKKYKIFSHYSSIKPLLCFDLSSENQNFQIIIVNVEYRFIGGRFGDKVISENQIWGLKRLKDDYGNVIIREEKIEHKILELFHKTEIDFKEDKIFSDRFYVESDNETKTRLALNRNIRNIFSSIPYEENFIIEILNDELIIGNRKSINLLNSNQIANFLNNNF